MKKKFGKFLSILLTVAMMLSLLPATAFADDRTVVKNVVAVSNSDMKPEYGKQTADHTFTVTEGQPAWLNGNDWWKLIDGEWTLMADGDTFGEGTYRYRAQLRIDDKKFDGKDKTTHVLAKNDITLTVDGKAWDMLGSVTVGDGNASGSYVRVCSKPFAVEAPEGQGLKFYDSGTFDIGRNYVGRAITSYSVADNVEGGTQPYKFEKFSGPAWIHVSNEGLISGTPTAAGENADLVVQVTDSNSAAKTITIEVADTKINPDDRTEISAVTATSDIKPEYGEQATNPTFTVTEGKPAWLNGNDWWKMVDGEWTEMAANDIFGEGVYRYRAQLRIDSEKFDGDDGTTHVLAKEGLTLKVDEKDWEVGSVSVDDDVSSVRVFSPAFTVTKPVVLALAVKNIKTPVPGETADTSGIIINNNISATVSSAQWFKETSGGHGSALEPMDASDKFVAGGTYYLSIKYEIADGYMLSNSPEIQHDLTDGIAEHNASAKVITIKYKVKDLGIILKDGVASWNAVDGADNYKWTLANNTIGGMIRSDEERSIDLQARLFSSGKESGTYTFTVQAFNKNEAVSNLASVEYVFTTTHTHDWDEEWDMNENYHWHNCKNDGCGVTNNALKLGHGPHTFEGDTCTGCGKNASLVDAPVITIKDGIASWTQIEGTWRYWWGLDNNTIGGWAEPGEKINLRERLAGKEDGTYSFTVQAFTSMTTPLSEKASVNYNYTETIIKTPIESVVLSGVDEPAIGATPDFDIILTDHIKSDGIYWRKLNTETENWENIDASTPFSAGKYWLKVELYSDEGYEFTTGTKFYFGEDELSRFDGTFKSNYDYEGGKPKPIIHILYTLEESAPEAETITELSATVTAPVADEIPSAPVADGEGYTVTFEWWDEEDTVLYPEDGDTFEAGKQYTVWVGFEPKDGYVFDEDASVKINGKAAEEKEVRETSAYGILTFTVEAEEESAIVTIEMKTGDNVEGYTTAQEEALGILIKKGLLVPDMELKGFKNGEGKLLFTLDEDTGEIEVAEGLTDEDSIIYELTSEEQAVVKEHTGEDISEIRLIFIKEEPVVTISELSATVTEPVAGEKLSFEATAGGEGYDAEVIWECDTDEVQLYPEDNAAFEAGKEYTLYIEFTAKDGYDFAADATITINEKTAEMSGIEETSAYGGIKYTVEAEDEEESNIVTIEMKTGDYVEGYTTAQACALEVLVFKGLLVPDMELEGFTDGEGKLLITIDEETGEIEVVTGLTAEDNITYVLTADEKLAVKEEFGEDISEIRLIFVSGASEPTEISELSATVTAPVAGEIPSVPVADGEGYTVVYFEWIDVAEETKLYPEDGDTFEAGKQYTVWVGFEAKPGYIFDEGASVEINGKPAEEKVVEETFAYGILTFTVETEEHEHAYSEEWSKDETYHWHAATCGHEAVANKAAHDFGGDRTCDVCRYTKPASSSGGGGGSTKYKVTAEDTDNGSVTLSKTNAAKGTTVTITVDPEAGYEVDKVVVVTKSGKEVEVTDKGDGTFTFKMPAEAVSTEVTYKEAVKEEADEAVSIVLTIDSVIAWVFDEYMANDVAPVIRNERTMLPARFVAEALGGVVTWNEEAQKVTIVNGEDTIEIFIGESFATVNGTPVELDSPAFIENSRTYLPIRFIAENMGATVTWDADARTVTIVPGK